MFRRKIAVNTVSTLTTVKDEDAPSKADSFEEIRLTILTAEAAITRTVAAVGLVIVGVAAAKTTFRIIENIAKLV